MKLTAQILCAFLFTCWSASAQITPVRATPDCDKSYSGATTGATTTYDNSDTQCAHWQVLIDVFNASPAISATFQHAPWNSGGTGAGTFATFGGQLVSGANPCITPNCLGIFTGHFPFVRVNVTSLTGTYRIRIIGWRALPPSASGVASGCTSQAAIVITGSGNTQIIAASTGLTPVICSVRVAAETATNLKLTRGTGTNCGTGTADITGLYYQVLTLKEGSDASPVLGAQSGAVCINSSAAVNIGGLVMYKYVQQ